MTTTLCDLGGEPARAPKLAFERVLKDDPDPEFPGRQPYDPDNIVVGVLARAVIMLPYGPSAWITTTIDSPGLWGVEVKSAQDPYLDDVYKDELATLKEMLAELGNLPIKKCKN